LTQRERIKERAASRCEYCRAPEGIGAYTFHLEHITPRISGGGNTDDNFAFSCWHCNSKKGKQTSARDPQSGATVPLFNPRSEDWDTHFRCDKVTAMIHGKTSTGRATVQAFAMNAPLQIEARE